MSYELALERVCSHQVYFETVVLEGDHQTVKFLKNPVNQSIQIYVDGFQVPQQGLVSPATLPFSKPEPYNIRAGINDLIYLQIGTGEIPRFIQLIPGHSLRASDIAKDLSLKIPDLDISVQNKRVVFTNKSASMAVAFAFVDPRWTDKTSSLPTTSRVLGCYTQIGIVPGRQVTGGRNYPGWVLTFDPNSFDSNNKKLVFLNSLLNHDAFVQASYVTSSQECRRCNGTRIEFDYGTNGDQYETVFDTDLLSQEFDKFIFTRLGSHWKWNWLGSNLIGRIGSKSNVSNSPASALITSDISQAFSIYQNIKSQQDKRYPQQQVSDAEYPYSLNSINVQSPQDDPTTAIVSVSVSSRSQVEVPFQRLIGSPNQFIIGGDPTRNILSNSIGFLNKG